MVIHINGWPGAGKYTVGRLVAQELGARLVANHSICAPGFCVADFGTPTFFDVVRQVRAIVFEEMEKAPPAESFVWTSVLIEGDDDAGRFDRIREIAARRGSFFLGVTLNCALEEIQKRMNTANRADRNSLTDAEMLRSLHDAYELLGPRDGAALDLDTTSLPARKNAARIVEAARRLSTADR
jgi:predicted kinase